MQILSAIDAARLKPEAFQFKAPPLNEHYEGAYPDFALEWRRLGAIDKAARIKALLGDEAGLITSVLEVGCGTGVLLAHVKGAGIGVDHIGIDLADPGEHRDRAAADLDLRAYAGGRLPFDDASFDLVYASHVIEHVADPRALLAEMRRVARLFVYIEVPCELTLRSSYQGMQRSLDIGHINSYTEESFALTLATSNLEPLRLRLFDHSLEVHAFFSTRWKAWAKLAIRRATLAIWPTAAKRVFTFDCGALCI